MLGAGRVNVQSWGEALVNPALYKAIHGAQQSILVQLVQLTRRAQAMAKSHPRLMQRLWVVCCLASTMGWNCNWLLFQIWMMANTPRSLTVCWQVFEIEERVSG